jgi:hypothetical protein
MAGLEYRALDRGFGRRPTLGARRFEMVSAVGICGLAEFPVLIADPHLPL